MRAALQAAPAAEGAVPRRVWGATLLLALARQWGALCTFLTLAWLARVLAAEEFGRFTFYLALFSFLDVFVDCGTSTVAVQRGAGDPVLFAAAVAAGRRVRAGAAGLAALLVGLGAWLGGERELLWVLVAALGPLARVAEMSAVVFQREIAWGTPVLLRALGASVRLGAIVLLAHAGVARFGPFLLVHAGGIALGNVALHFVARGRLPPARRPLGGMLRLALPLALLGLCQQAYFYADNLFVRGLCGPAELGRYNACVRIFSWLVFFAAFATTAALPWLARRHQEGELGGASVRLAQPLFLAACAGTGALWPWSGELLRLVFGAGFETAGASLRWLLAAAIAVSLGATFLTAVIAAGRTRAALAIAALALAVNLLANALLVPRLGGEGAAAATLATEGTVALASLTALAALGCAPRARPWRWLGGPALFALAFLASRALSAALPGT